MPCCSTHTPLLCARLKSSATRNQLIDFDEKVDRVMLRATKDAAYRVYEGVSILPVIFANHLLESEEKLRSTAHELGILLIARNGVEYGPRLMSDDVSDCELYRSLLRPPLA